MSQLLVYIMGTPSATRAAQPNELLQSGCLTISHCYPLPAPYTHLPIPYCLFPTAVRTGGRHAVAKRNNTR